METEIGPNERVSSAVSRAVGAVEGREPESLPPLTDVIDPAALDALFDAQPGGESRTGGCLSFIYSHCRVAIDNGEYLTIQPLGSTARNSRPFEIDNRHRTDRGIEQ